MEEWKSPRQIEEDILLYRRKRFEFYMGLEALKICTREEALEQLRAEIKEADGDSPSTQPMLILLPENDEDSNN